jgi:hypothetical protein
MKPNSITQSDTNLNFDGAEKIAPGRSSKYSGNQHAGVQNPNALINKGRGPTVGNKSDDGPTYPDARVMPKLPAQGSVRDNINRGPQVRSSGGGRFPETRTWAPSAGQNYHGNADKINMGRGPTKGNQI